MKRLHIATSATLLATALFGASLHAADNTPTTPLQKEEVSIPFLDKGSLNDWQADGESALWVQDKRKQWYYAKLQSPCIGLDFAISIGFQTRSLNSFDRFSAIVVPNQPNTIPCQLTSLTKSDGPPGKEDGTQDSASK